VLLAIAGYGAGSILWPDIESAEFDIQFLQTVTLTRILVSSSFALFGFAFGYVLAPFLFAPLHAAYCELRETPPEQLVGATVGLTVGLLLSALVAWPLSFLPAPFGEYLPVIVAVALGYLGAAIMGGNPGIYLGLLRGVASGRQTNGYGGAILLDTSVIIDGRVADVADTGFIDRPLKVPRFVLAELQRIADSADTMRRNRGRRGLEMLNRLQHADLVDVEILDRDVPGTDDVDRKLVRLAEQMECAIMTNDFNLNKVADIQGIRVLNLNELSNAVKTLMLPGEQMEVRIIQEGKERGQGVAYLEDGTMVVVEEGVDFLDSTITVTVTRVIQTVAGRMIFAVPAVE
jgi:uncharacterized protein YacL